MTAAIIQDAFPQLDDTACAAIAHAYHRWTLETDAISPDEERAAIIGFAAGWINRPASDFSH